MKKLLCVFLVCVLIPCTLFATSASDVVAKLIIGLLEKVETVESVETVTSFEIPTRDQISEEDKWDLSSYYHNEEEFLKDLEALKSRIAEAANYSGIMDNSKKDLLKVLTWYYDSKLIQARTLVYADLCYATDLTNSEASLRERTVAQLYASFDAAVSFFAPELLASKNVEAWIEDEMFADYKIAVKKLLRLKDHTLSTELENLLVLGKNVAKASEDTYYALLDGELVFESVNGTPVTNSNFTTLLSSKDRSFREQVYKNYYASFESLKSTFANLYYGSVKQDVFSAKAHNYNNSLEASLFENDIDVSVYMNLIDTIHEALPILHRFYEVKRKALGLEKLAHYDVYVPLVDNFEINIPYDEAVDIAINALSPLGEEYTSVLKSGLTTEKWVDKYENKGKTSGAFSSLMYGVKPYISLNYQDKDLTNSIVALVHEGGHSMHTYYSKENPYSCFDYSIFHAEVASTFNEQLLYKYLIENAKSDQEKAFYISYQLDILILTLFRQTMFAEFELKCHQLVENGEPLTIETIRTVYRELLEAYFGPDVELLENSDLECFKISHFYSAYYVYQYSTSLCASIALSEKVLNGGQKELDDYLNFLKSGGSMYPIEALKKAGVDMSSPEPIRATIKKFERLIDEFEELTKYI